ncbi:MAG TPA: DUF4404 family protein [Arenicellales bacterium]|jgi:hypothetical protein|nr:DUF4404 family protein [Arenicellales bacterium]
MSEQELEQLIEKLRREVEALPDDDVDARQRLNAIIEELDRKLAEPGTEDHHGLVSNLQDSIKELEVRHPDTTTLLNNIMMTLANMGI